MTKSELVELMRTELARAMDPFSRRLDLVERRMSDVLREARDHVSSSDLSHQAKEAAMIVHMKSLESALRAADKKADEKANENKAIALSARADARRKFALDALLRVAVSAIATAAGAYFALKGIHP